MEGSKKVLAMAGVCALLVLSFMAADVNAQCNMNQLSACMGAVTSGTPPTELCCKQIGGIQDFNCFCTMMINQRSSIRQEWINNAVLLPSKCGPYGQKLRNRQCRDVRIP